MCQVHRKRAKVGSEKNRIGNVYFNFNKKR